MTTANRRHFLKQLASMGSVSTLSRLSLLGGASLVAESSFASSDDYKAIVCLMLVGGNDGANTLFETDTNKRSVYEASRSSVVINEALTPLNNPAFAVHPKLTKVAELFNSGKLAFVPNVGVLNKPTTKKQIVEKLPNLDLPAYIFSHNSMRSRWQNATTDISGPVPQGWGSKLLSDTSLSDQNQSEHDNDLPAAVSFGTRAELFTGDDSLRPYVLAPTGAMSYRAFDKDTDATSRLKDSFEQLQQAAQSSDFEQELSGLQTKNLKVSANVDDYLAATEQSTEDDGTDLKQSLDTIVKAIKNRGDISTGINRQMFYVSHSNYDTHNSQLLKQDSLLAELDDALDHFQSSLDQEGLSDKVTLVLMSDFGRTVSANHSGTDHGWGSHYFVLGGAVNGGQIYGEMPDLSLTGDDIALKGRLIPKTPIEQYFYPTCRWFGLSDEEFAEVFPLYTSFRDHQNNLEDANDTFVWSDLGYMRYS